MTHDTAVRATIAAVHPATASPPVAAAVSVRPASHADTAPGPARPPRPATAHRLPGRARARARGPGPPQGPPARRSTPAVRAHRSQLTTAAATVVRSHARWTDGTPSSCPRCAPARHHRAPPDLRRRHPHIPDGVNDGAARRRMPPRAALLMPLATPPPRSHGLQPARFARQGR